VLLETRTAEFEKRHYGGKFELRFCGIFALVKCRRDQSLHVSKHDSVFLCACVVCGVVRYECLPGKTSYL
jgi:hypothetical protein